MKCFIYKSLKKEDLFLYLDKKDNFSILPESLLDNLGQLEFVMELEMSPKRKLAREDAKKVLLNLQEKSFFIQMPPTRIPAALLVKNSKLH